MHLAKLVLRLFGFKLNSTPWDDSAPVRQELFGVERLELHAQSLAAAQQVTLKPRSVVSLHARLLDNDKTLLAAYRGSVIEVENGRSVVPAAEWLLDNYHLVENQIREIQDDLPMGYYRQLPKLAGGPFAGYPRVLGLVWAYVAHSDSHFDYETLRRYLIAYQSVQPLRIGELWAVAITLRIVLIENLRRLADQISSAHLDRQDANSLTEQLLQAGNAHVALQTDIAERDIGPLSESFAAQLAKRLRDQDPRTMPALDWLEQRLQAQGQTIADVVQNTHLRQGASNVSIRNIILSLRLISDIDWAELVESVSLVDRCLCAGSKFAFMDFRSRNLYRSAIEQLAKGSQYSELEIAQCVLQQAHQFAQSATSASVNSTGNGAIDPAEIERQSDPGFYLIDSGRAQFEQLIGFRPTFSLTLNRFQIRLGMIGYVGSILTACAVLLLGAIGLLGVPTLSWTALVVGIFGILPATEAVTALVDRTLSWRLGARLLPGLELIDGVPSHLRTLIAVPILLENESDIRTQVERLEVHFLSGIEGDVSFALLSDGVDADTESVANDQHLIHIAALAIDTLNQRYGPSSSGPRFILLHRRRQFNLTEQKWMGWERKRGKLHELNRLLRGATDTSFVAIDQQPIAVPQQVRYVIVLDADTSLPRESALKLIGKMAHPLNRAQLCESGQRVIRGHGILQPRVTPSLSTGTEGSLYQRIFSSPGGIDPYSAAVSNVYQDLFGEGSFTGKGIYDVDAFSFALAGRVSDNTMLSHDLFEGIFARAGLVTDIDVVEEFPARYDVVANRLHRWTRGDWQLLPWIFGKFSVAQAASRVGRYKMLDNLRRSLVPPATLAALCLCWLWPLPTALLATSMILCSFIIPAFLPSVFALVPRHAGVNIQHHMRMLLADLKMAAMQCLLQLAFLPDHAWRMGDAIVRTLWRMSLTKQHLLEWKTAAQTTNCPRLSIWGFYRVMARGTGLAAVLIAVVTLLNTDVVLLLMPFALLWLSAPAIALWSSRPPSSKKGPQVDADKAYLRLVARKTWRYFESFVTVSDNWLPPDNFQVDPEPVLAHRTSPTNMGLYLLSAAAARDFGWAGTLQTIESLEATLKSMAALPKFRGHFFNWYQTQSASVLPPEYVSSVDSGNLAGHLIALANACDEWQSVRIATNVRAGILDGLQLVDEAATAEGISTEHAQTLRAQLVDMETLLLGGQTTDVLAPTLLHALAKIRQEAVLLLPNNAPKHTSDLLYWIDALHSTVAEHLRDEMQRNDPAATADCSARLTAIAKQSRAMAMAMDFSFLLEPERKLLAIGYSVTENGLDKSCYDLLASEARLASLVAVAKGDVNTKHWFRLGRTATPIGKGSALISWSGSMFEYLMPSLVMRGPAGSLLEQTNRLIVERQRAYAKQHNIPWGISESAYNARDIELTYQYLNFGVPGLGLKRGLAEDLVVAPYATGLATMVDANAARQNFARLTRLGGYGNYGFYDALDFTRSRLPKDVDVVVVKNFMAHHQGMTIVAIANTLHAGNMRQRFHREPMIQACELLLQERIPRDVAISHPRAKEVQASSHSSHNEPTTIRRLSLHAPGAPNTHLLSNGRYTVMLTAAGSGYSRWQDIAITRWREDSTCDHWGSYILLQDLATGRRWSPVIQPLGNGSGHQNGVFSEDYAEFVYQHDGLVTTMEVLVSGEDDGEVRRISLSNNGRNRRQIELTSYAEVVLTTAAADQAHPAFAKLFVQTEFIAELGAIVATRRPRSSTDTPIWAAHFTIVEGEIDANPQYESDRMQFIGRGNSLANAVAMERGNQLSNTVGTVLDPIFSLRQRLSVAPGKVARVAFWTVVASSREALLDLIDRHHDRSAFDRAKTLAWTQAQVQLRHLGVDTAEAAEFQRLAAPLIYANPRFRASSATITRGAGPQSALWSLAISGDLPILLLRIDDIEDIGQVKQLLRAHEYWRSKCLAVDLVIVNEHPSSYLQDLQNTIETIVRSSQSRPRQHDSWALGSVYTLRSDLLANGHRDQLLSIARVVLAARHGLLKKQFKRLPTSTNGLGSLLSVRSPNYAAVTRVNEALPALEFFNGMGGFAEQGREYLTVIKKNGFTPAPWINIVANANFGFNAAAEGSGYTWAENSRENQLTGWSNDPVSAPVSEVIYVQEQGSREIYTATALPMRDGGTYIARHGFGYCQFTHQVNDLTLTLLQYVPLEDPIKISRLTIHNHSKRPRKLIVTAFTEWVLGRDRSASAPFVMTEQDDITGAILARNHWDNSFPGRVAFADLNGRQQTWSADRTEFLGRNGNAHAPAALRKSQLLSARSGAGLDPCAVLQCQVELAPGEQIEMVAFLGQGKDLAVARDLIQRYRQADLDAVLAAVKHHWADLLGSVQVNTPERSMDIMLNGWLLYQTLACRIWARSGFYQASGAYGFRDQLQDGMALTGVRPDLTRSHILRAAGRQFSAGDVQHWWLPHSGQGVRTHISDDRAWLVLATATYIQRTDDHSILDEMVSFLDGPELDMASHDAYFLPTIADESASLFEHCARALEQSLGLIGAHGLPLMGTGDWNDGMNQVGSEGRGESVWLAWLLIRAIGLFAPLAINRGPAERKRAEQWVEQAVAIQRAVEACAWDGQWYRRATFDNGSWLGSADNLECKIDSIAQSWAVLSGGANPERAAIAMASVEQLLVRPEQGLALLFTPPFDESDPNPGYIQGYPPGLRENGGQYSHAAMWAILAQVQLGNGDKACDLFNLVNPINHAKERDTMLRYKVEPYVVAADVYSIAPHVGRGGWTWYTGAAGWLYQAGIEGILGIRRQGNYLLVAPTIPRHWPGFEASVHLQQTSYQIQVVQTLSTHKPRIASAVLDNVSLDLIDDAIRLELDGGEHRVVINLI